MSEAERLVVFAPNWLGDAVMAVPCVQAIRRRYPAATLAVAARSHLAALYEMVEGVDEVVPLERAGRLGGPIGVVRDARRLGAGRFDVAILFPNSFRSAAIAWLAAIPRRCGYASDARALLLSEAVPRVHGGHMVEYYGRLVEALGTFKESESPRVRKSESRAGGSSDLGTAGPSDHGQAAMPSARVTVPADARNWAAGALQSRGWRPGDVLIGMAPGAAYGGAKQWPPQRFAEVAKAAWDPPSAGLTGRAKGTIKTVLVGSGGDRPACDEIARIAGDAVINLCGDTDLRQLAAVMAECRVFVSNDSGAMHLAAAVGVPVVAIFGSTNEKETAPLPLAAPRTGPGLKPGAYDEAAKSGDTVGPELQLGARMAPAHVILTTEVPCRPCMLRECPIEGHPCMTGISADRVLAAVRALGP